MTTSSANVAPIYYHGPAWVRCRCCEEFHCTIHGQHASTCPCPPIEQWAVDPYTTGRPIAMAERQALLDELIWAVKEARRDEVRQEASVQEARTYLGERQRAWQAAQDATRRAMRELKAFIDGEAGLPETHPGVDW
jgi:hypothetical protein